jgi:hypothetical protein
VLEDRRRLVNLLSRNAGSGASGVSPAVALHVSYWLQEIARLTVLDFQNLHMAQSSNKSQSDIFNLER